MKTPIIYYGGKTKMLPVIMPLVPPHTCYTEVFFGGGSVYWAKSPCENETINDRDNVVINFYQQLKTNYKQLKSLIDCTLFSRTLHDKSLLIIRNKELFTAVELAWAFWYNSNVSHTNKIGGGIKHSNLPNLNPPATLQKRKTEFTELLVSRIESTHIENRDAIKVLLSRNVVNAFHYLDSPYPGADQGQYRGYTWGEFEKLLIAAASIKGKFLLSNYVSPMLSEHIRANGWYHQDHKITNGGVRMPGIHKIETLVYNYTPSQQSMFNNQ